MTNLNSLVVLCVLIALGSSSNGLRREILSQSPFYEVSWEVDKTNNNTITFEINAETTGFVGFGLSPQGGMAGADIMTGGVFPNGTSYISDRYATANNFPPEDSHADWTLLSASENSTFTTLVVSRLLDTCDKEDVPITDDTVRFIWAMGGDDTLGYHYTNRGSVAVSVLSEAYPEDDLSKYNTFSATTEVSLPPKDTLYYCTVHSAPVFNGKQHAVAFGAALNSEESVRHSHHLSLYRCKAPSGQDPQDFFQKYIDQGGIDCLDRLPGQISAYAYCTELIYTWTVGGRIMHMPEGVGFPLGENEHEYYLMESHFDNPNLLDVTFESGVTIFYTSDLRPIEAGNMRIGQMYSYNFLVPPNSEDYKVVGHCSSNCTQQWVPQSGVDIFNVMLHTHAYGSKMKLRHFRGRTELPWVMVDDNFSFNYQDNRNIAPLKWLPGDQFAIECNYDNSMLNPPSTVIGGFGTRQEMCEVVLYYFPRIGIENCRSNIQKPLILNHFGIGSVGSPVDDTSTDPVITSPPEMAGMTVTEYLNTLSWNGTDRDALESLMRFSLHEEQCGGDGFQKKASHKEETYYVTYPEIDEVYEKPPSQCQ